MDERPEPRACGGTAKIRSRLDELREHHVCAEHCGCCDANPAGACSPMRRGGAERQSAVDTCKRRRSPLREGNTSRSLCARGSTAHSPWQRHEPQRKLTGLQRGRRPRIFPVPCANDARQVASTNSAQTACGGRLGRLNASRGRIAPIGNDHNGRLSIRTPDVYFGRAQRCEGTLLSAPECFFRCGTRCHGLGVGASQMHH